MQPQVAFFSFHNRHMHAQHPTRLKNNQDVRIQFVWDGPVQNVKFDLKTSILGWACPKLVKIIKDVRISFAVMGLQCYESNVYIFVWDGPVKAIRTL